MTQKQITFYGDTTLLARIDAAVEADQVHNNRTSWIRQVIIDRLDSLSKEYWDSRLEEMDKNLQAAVD